MRRAFATLGVFLLLLLALPSFLSLNFVQNQLIKPFLPVELHFRTFEVSWLGPQRVFDVRWRELSAEKVTFATPLWKLPFQQEFRVPELQVQGTDLKLFVTGSKSSEKTTLQVSGDPRIQADLALEGEKLETVQGTLNLKNFPAVLPALREFFGETLTADIRAEETELFAAIQSSNLQGKVHYLKEKGEFSSDSQLQLTLPLSQPLIFTFRGGPTPTISSQGELFKLRRLKGTVVDKEFSASAELGRGTLSLKGTFGKSVAFSGEELSLWPQLLGERLRFTFKADSGLATLYAKSSALSIPGARFSYSRERVQLLDALTIQAAPYGNSSSIKLEKFLFPKPFDLNWQDVEIIASLSAREFQYEKYPAIEGLYVSLEQDTLAFLGRVPFREEKVKLELTTELNLQEGFFPKKIKGKVEGRSLFGEFTSDQPYTFSGSFAVRISEFLREKMHGVSLANPALAQLFVESIEFDPESFEMRSGSGKVLIDELLLQDDERSVATFRKIASTWNLKEELWTLFIEGASANSSYATEGNFIVSAEIASPLQKLQVKSGSISLDKLPSLPMALVDKRLPFLLGAYISGSAEIDEGIASYNLQAEFAEAKGKLRFSREGIALEEPARLVAEVSPEAFKELHCASTLKLISPAYISGELQKGSYRFGEYSSLDGEGTFSLEKLELMSFGDHMFVRSMGMAAKANGGVVDYSLEGAGFLQNSPSEGFRIESTGKQVDLLKKSGTISLNARYTPTILLGELFCLPQEVIKQLEILVGERTTVAGNFSFVEGNGPAQLNVQGTAGNLSLDARIAGGVVTLEKPLTLFVNITPRLSDSILDELLPFLDAAVSSESPLRFQIEPDGFSWRIYGDPLQGLSIGQMTLDMGVVEFTNEYTIAELLQILKYGSASSTIEVWFTPLYASFTEGVLRVQRMDMLVAQRYPVAVWGKVNFAADKVKMTVGLGGLTLRRAFGLKGVPSEYYLQVALKGTTKNASLDVRGSATKLAAFISQLKGSPLGGIVDILSGGLGQKKTPRPTTQPFPWD